MAEAPNVYDVEADETRPITQVDVAVFEAVTKAYGDIRSYIDQRHARLMAEVRDIRSRAGLPHNPDAAP